MTVKMTFAEEEWSMKFREASSQYEDPSEAERIWMNYRNDCYRGGVENQAVGILDNVNTSARLDILLDELVRMAEFENVAKENIPYSSEETHDPNATLVKSNFLANEHKYLEDVCLPSSASKKVILYKPGEKGKSNARFFSRQHKKRLEELAKRKRK